MKMGGHSLTIWPTGLYLVMGDSYEKGPQTYTPDPFALGLPNPMGKQGNGFMMWKPPANMTANRILLTEGAAMMTHQVAVEVVPCDRHPQGAEDLGTTAAIQKPPARSSCSTLKDGVVSSTVTLSASKQLVLYLVGVDANSNWQVVERDVANGYTRFARTEGDLFRVTTYQEDVPVTPPSTGVRGSRPGRKASSQRLNLSLSSEEKLPPDGHAFGGLFRC